MKSKSVKTKLLTVLLTFCMILSLMPISAFATAVNYINEIHVSYTHINYQAGDTPQATAAVTNSDAHCTVAYEYWREIYQKEEGGVWSGTGRYWYSDADKMAALSPEKRITEFEAGKHYSYNIVLVTDRGYFISEDETVVSVGEYEWGTPGRHTNLEIKEMSTKLFIYSPYSVDIPKDNTDKVITAVSITNVNKNLDPSKPVAFTAKAGSDCADKFDITEEMWEKSTYGEEEPVNDVIKSTETSHAPIQGGEYWYSIVLTAKDGYVFSEDFSDENLQIKDGSNVTFTLGGILYNGSFALSDDRKTLTAWEFMDPVTAQAIQLKPIDSVEITDATISFNAGDTPIFTGKVPNNDEYVYQCEWWETDGAGINSSDFWNREDIYESFITEFESNKTYKYGLYLKANQGYYFTADTKLKINGKYYDYKRSPDDTELSDSDGMAAAMWVYTDLTMTPSEQITTPDYKIIEGANGTWTQSSNSTFTFRANGDFSKFKGIKIDGKLITEDNYIAVSGSTVITLKADYLKTLSVGKHELTVLYNDGECSTSFNVNAVQTGDSNHFIIWFVLLFISGSIITAVKVKNKMKKRAE